MGVLLRDGDVRLGELEERGRRGVEFQTRHPAGRGRALLAVGARPRGARGAPGGLGVGPRGFRGRQGLVA